MGFSMIVYALGLQQDLLSDVRKSLAKLRIRVDCLPVTCLDAAGVLLQPTDGVAPSVLVGMDAIRLCGDLRARGVTCPAIGLLEPGTADRTLSLFEAGADDVMIAPVLATELKARINAIVRRMSGHAAPVIRLGEIEAYLDGRPPRVSGREIRLTDKEQEIFRQLVLRPDAACRRDALFSAVYSLADRQPEERAIDMHVYKLRRKISALAESGASYIETVPGGYRIRAAHG